MTIDDVIYMLQALHVLDAIRIAVISVVAIFLFRYFTDR